MSKKINPSQKLFPLLSVLLMVSSFVNGQAPVVDTFETWINRVSNDSVRLARAVEVSKYFENIDSAKAWKYFKIAEQLSAKEKSVLSKIKILELEGVLYTKHNPAKAYILYQQAVELCKNENSKAIKLNEASLMNNLGVISFLNADYESAVQSFIESVSMYEKYDPAHPNIPNTLNNVSTTYEQMQYPAKAIQYSIEATRFAEKHGSARIKAICYIGAANNFLKLNKPDSGLINLKKAFFFTDSTKDQYHLFLCNNLLGFYHEKKDNADSAMFYYRKCLPLAQAINSPYDVSAAFMRMANVEIGVKDLRNAKQNLDSAETIITIYDFRDNKKDLYELQSEYYKAAGNLVLANSYLKKYVELKDSIADESRIKRIDFLEERYQSEKKQNTISSLEEENKIQQLYLKKRTVLNYILTGSLVTILVIGFLLYRNYRQRQQLQQQKISELEKDKQLVAVDSLLKGQEEERGRLAKDLHDGLGGLLSGVKFSLSNMKDNLIVTPDNMAVFERSLDMLDTSIKELRRVAHNMMPEMLAKFGLDEALKEYSNSVTATKLVAVKYQSFGMDERLSSSTEVIIYRIVQELVNNILKHASASEVLVQLIKEGNRLSVLVEDNGKGFDTSILETNKGAGWSSIRSRVDYLKGRIDIHSELNKGTTVTMEFNV